MERMPSMAFAGRPSALAEPFVPNSARRVAERHTSVGHGGHGGHRTGGGVVGGGGGRGRVSAPRNASNGETYASGELRSHAREEAALLARTSPAVPDFVGGYAALYPLDGALPRALLPPHGAHLQQFKAMGSDGEPAALLRVVGPPPAGSNQIVRASEAWRRVRHSGVSRLKEVFTATAFNAQVHEVVISYAFPGRARPFSSVFLSPTQSAYGAPRAPPPLPEDALWALATQLLSQVAECHKHGLALRGALDPSAVLVVGRNRVRLFGVGLNDMLDPLGADHISQTSSDRARLLAKDDLNSLSQLLLLLSLRSNGGAVRGGVLALSVAHSLDVLRQATPYGTQWVHTVEALVDASAVGSQRTINDVLQVAATRIAEELGNVWGHADALTKLLFDELEASRMLRLSSLISFVTERDDPSGTPTPWSETGDRYVVKLFRDFLYHRQDDAGRAIMDMASVVDALHRLDIGSQEQVLLGARDGKSLLVASYDEVRRCLTHAVDELILAGHKPPAAAVNSRSVGARTLQRY